MVSEGAETLTVGPQGQNSLHTNIELLFGCFFFSHCVDFSLGVKTMESKIACP